MTTTTDPLNQVDFETVAGLANAIAADPSKGATVWKADVTWKGGFRTETRIRDFVPTPCDEPSGLGGGDTAPNPVEQLLGALGSCLAIGVAANATAREIAIQSLTVTVDGDLDLSTFLGLTQGHAGYEGIRAHITLESEADPAAVEDLVRHVVSTSPVGHTLAREIPLTVTHR
jgi:uncharacterized OsmC-like protein